MKAMTRVIIMAAGDGERWGNCGGIPKHMISIDGESLIVRTVRLARTHGMEVIVSGPYPDLGVPAYLPLVETEPVDGRLGVRALWNGAGQTIILMGDVWYSEDAMSTIARHVKRDMHLFARFGPSTITGKDHAEIFANSFWPEHHATHEDSLRQVYRMHRAGKLWRAGMWEAYAYEQGVTVDTSIRQLGNATVIDDWSDDFDLPEDLPAWLERR